MWDTAGTSLIGPITTNLRPYFNADTEPNFSSWLIGVLPAQVLDAPLAVQCAALQQSMEAQLNEAAMRGQLATTVRTMAGLKEKSLEELAASAGAKAQTVAYTRNFISMYVSNVGSFDVPEPLAGMVRGLSLSLPSWQSSVNIAMVSVGDAATLSLTQTFETDALYQALLAEFADNGLNAEGTDQGWHCAPTLGVDAFQQAV